MSGMAITIGAVIVSVADAAAAIWRISQHQAALPGARCGSAATHFLTGRTQILDVNRGALTRVASFMAPKRYSVQLSIGYLPGSSRFLFGDMRVYQCLSRHPAALDSCRREAGLPSRLASAELSALAARAAPMRCTTWRSGPGKESKAHAVGAGKAAATCRAAMLHACPAPAAAGQAICADSRGCRIGATGRPAITLSDRR